MSFDLVIWSGNPSAPTRQWGRLRAEDEAGLPPIPHEELTASLRATFGEDIRVLPFDGGCNVLGRGWEVDIGPGTHVMVSCNWGLVGEPAILGAIVRAAHAAGCSVYDPQNGAHWPTFSTPGADDLWQSAFFDEAFLFEDEDDDVGHVAEQPKRLKPDEVAPTATKVWLEVPMALARAAPGETRRRIRTYQDRFVGWELIVALTGPESEALSIAERRKVIKEERFTEDFDEPVGIVSFHVVGTFDPVAAIPRIDLCPFEVVAQSPEEILLASIFEELPVRWIVVVATRTLRAAPDAVRAGLRALHAAASEAGPAHYSNPLASREAPVGANVAWVEALLGLSPSEAPIEVDAATVPRPPAPEQSDDDDEQ